MTLSAASSWDCVQVAFELSTDVKTVRQAVNSGELRSVRVGGKPYVPRGTVITASRKGMFGNMPALPKPTGLAERKR